MNWRPALRQPGQGFALSALLILSLLFLSLPPPLRAADAEADSQGAERTRFSFRGQFAEAFFASLDETGCIVSSVAVFAVSGRTKEEGRPERGSTVTITITKLDTCRGQELMSAEGTFGFGNGDLGESLRIDHQLRTATLVAPIQVLDSISGHFIDLFVRVEWNGNGNPFRVKDHFRVKQPGLRVHSKFDGTFRRASATAQIEDGQVNLTPLPTGTADMGSVKQGEIAILR